MENANYEEMLRNVEPSERIVPYLMTQELKHLTIYQVCKFTEPLTGISEKMMKCVCSACGHEYLAECVPLDINNAECGHAYPMEAGRGCGFVTSEGHVVVSGEYVFCPMCGEYTEACHISRFGGMKEKPTDEYDVQEIRKIDGHLVLLQWYFSHLVARNGEERFTWARRNAFVVEPGKVVRLNAFKRIYYYGYFEISFRQTKKCLDDFGAVTILMPWDKHILDGTPAENSKLDIYLQQKGCGLYPVSYLRLYLKHKNIENLMTCGAGEIVADMIEKDWRIGSGYGQRGCAAIPRLDDIDWHVVKPSEMLGINKTALRRAAAEKWNRDMLEIYRLAKSGGEDLTKEELLAAEKIGITRYADWIRAHEMSVGKILRYLIRQREDMSCYRDYYDMAEEIGHDMSDPQVLRPKNLYRAHDEARALLKIKNLRPQHEQFTHRADALKKYTWENSGILIRPVASEDELVHEGDALHHCVATYADRHCRAECAIFVIRKADAPDEPWYTLELNEKCLTVTQNRGMRNCARTEEVADFEAAWIEHIRSIKTKGERRE